MFSTQTQLVNTSSFDSPLNPNESLSLFNTNKYPSSLQLPFFSTSSSSSPRTIAFVDANVADASTVLADVQADIKILLDSTRDGITQISEVLKHYTNLTSVGIISHGFAGGMQLGGTLLSASSLSQYAGAIQQWGASLTEDADILLYGCNIAYGDLGQGFVQNLSILTGADIAASTDLTGDAPDGGNWTLEYNTGSIEATNPFTSAFLNSYRGVLASLFTTQTPTVTNATDGSGSAGDYELGMEFRSAKAGTIDAIRYYKAPSETGTHIGRIWDSNGNLLGSVTFTNETGSGWQQQALATPISIQANTTYVVSVNVNSYYAATPGGLATTLTNGDLSAVADGSNGVFNVNPGSFPTQSWNNSNYFRDVVFTPNAPVNNTPGTINWTGTATQNQVLTATVADADGLNGVTINYQWQQSSDGTTWTNITGATSATLNLAQAQVGNQVRVTANYTDALGSTESLTSTATGVVANVNDPGVVAINGVTAQGNTLTANLTDLDGLPGTISYQWQQSSNGTTWTDITGATTQTLSLTSGLVGQQVRVRAIYTDLFNANEDVLSTPTTTISASAPGQSLFTTQTPTNLNATDGTGSAGDYELGMEFRSARAGQITAIRYYKAANETGTHIGRIWDSNGNLLGSVTFTNETASGWQQQTLATPIAIQANTTYVVSVNVNSYYVLTPNGIATTLTNGDLSAVADGSNGVFNVNPGSFPTQSWNNSNYFRDVVFTPNAPVNNTPGTINWTGTATQNQVLTATVADADGLNGVTINYQWQQSSNGTTWTNISGATSATLNLAQAQVGNQVRVTANYTDALGSSESLTSTATGAVANVNDPGVIAINGVTAQGNTLTANLTDLDGLPGTISYQWQQSSNGTTWTDIAGATSQTLSLDNSLVGQQIRVSAIYTDVLGGNENVLSIPSATISASAPGQSLFTTQTPTNLNATDGTGAAGDYELGMEFRSAKAGQITAIRYYKAANETGTHIGRIWDSNGNLLGSVTFTSETGSGWQQQALTTPINIQANTTYIVSVNVNSYYVVTPNGIATTLTNGDLSAVADGSNGVFNVDPGNFPTQSWNNSNYFRDVVFTPTAPVNNTPGTINWTGTATQNQVLTATVADADGLNGVTINYQWQQSSNGTTWTNIAGATSQTFILSQTQVGNQVRVTANYIDTQGSSESLTSSATAVVANVNDPGLIAISGITAQGNTLAATLTDPDGLSGVTINYQWQQSTDNGSTWSNIPGATNRFLTLDNSFVGNRVRATTTYTDALGSSEVVSSTATLPISALLENIFASTTTPSITNASDGTAYELGLRFSSAKAGQIQAIRYWKAPGETGTHVGKIWSSTGELLASVTFTNETASGWQQQVLPTPVFIAPNTTYVVSVNANSHYAITSNGLTNPITTGDLGVPVSGGVFGTPGALPTQSYQSSNYYRDVVFALLSTPTNNNPGSISWNGAATEKQSLTASISDADGIVTGTIKYQWQQSSDNGTTWSNITGATRDTLTLSNAQVNNQVRVKATYIDTQGSYETVISNATTPIANINDLGVAILKGSATTGNTLTGTILDDDGLSGVTINYQWQQFVNNTWSNIAGATFKSLTLTTELLNQQVRLLASYIDSLGTSESVASLETTVSAQNAIVLENQKQGTTAWQITNLATNNEILGYASATSVNQGGVLPIKVSLAQPGQYRIDVYRLGYYGGSGGRFITSSGLLNGGSQTSFTFDPSTRLVEYNWNTSYNLAIGNDWTSGLYVAKLTDITTGKESQINFVVRDDDRPADLGFQASFTNYEAYNNFGGYSTYDATSAGNQRAYKVSFDRPQAPLYQGALNSDGLKTPDGFRLNNMMTWEYNMVRWLESQGYDVSYYTNLDVHTNPLQLYSQNAFLSVGHDEYWSMEMMDNVTKARDNGINLAFFSANTAYWRVRFEPSSTGETNRVMVVYKQDWALDPVAQADISQATTLFRSPELNRPENSLLGVAYIGNTGGENTTQGFDFVVSNSSDPYYAHTGLQNGDILPGLVGYEWDAVLNNGFTPSGLVVLSESFVIPTGGLPPLPPGTNLNIANAVRYTAPSGAKVFSTGSIQWSWGLDSFGVSDRTDPRAQQITVNVLKDMGAIPETPSSGIVVT